MGLLRSLVMMLLLIWFLWLPGHRAQLPNSEHELDALLQNYAYKALVRPKTGLPYDGDVPPDLIGIKVAALRLRSGSLRRKGVPMYKEFEIPIGVIERPYVERLVLVYQNLGNWSERYYSLAGYTHLAPVLGLLAYNASNLSATNLPVLDIRASGDPITIKFSDVKSVPDGFVAMCVSFDLQGKEEMQQMERAADVGEALQMTSVGETKAPAAMVTRTQPTLENEYVP
ncbi:hypothetical protein GH714_003844 [Hevea brasiliensis]|uniref:Uncharacterized protein n=1 Tax=Hevea brasiliensis TaxID=3981 RepID=A0A6A6KIW1_HEVBR|nr:hypothetical protein GH714_003844 [Hevea brasiliensis]